jgi:methyltransferase
MQQMWSHLDPSDSRLLYTALVGLVALMRLVELAVSRRNATRLESRGGVEVGARHYPWMVVVHTAFLFASPLEVWLLQRPWMPAVGIPMLVLLAAAAVLRWWVIATLGDRWTTRVIHVPDEPLVASGPYRWLRHPNYLAVAVEFVALPLVHTAWLSAIIFSAANAAVLIRRIRVEDDALRSDDARDGRPSPATEGS